MGTGRSRTRGVPRGASTATFSWPREPPPSQRTCAVSRSLHHTQLVPLLPLLDLPQDLPQDHHQHQDRLTTVIHTSMPVRVTRSTSPSLVLLVPSAPLSALSVSSAPRTSQLVSRPNHSALSSRPAAAPSTAH